MTRCSWASSKMQQAMKIGVVEALPEAEEPQKSPKMSQCVFGVGRLCVFLFSRFVKGSTVWLWKSYHPLIVLEVEGIGTCD